MATHPRPSRRRAIAIGVALALGTGAPLALSASPAAAGTRAHAPAAHTAAGSTRVIVQTSARSRAEAAGIRERVRALGGTVTTELGIVNGFAATIPAGSESRVAHLAGVRAVTPDEHVKVSGGVDTSTGPASVYAAELGAAGASKYGIDGRGVTVALVDTGVAPVADLAGSVLRVDDPSGSGAQVDCVNFSGEADCNDSYGHGTFIAGLIAGNGSSSGGAYQGMAPGAKIVSLKIGGRDGSADVSKVLAAIQWSVSFKDQYHIRILNLSLGTDSRVSYHVDPLNYAVERAWRSGIAVVVSASNRGPAAGTISKPADDPLVITVGALDDRGTADTSDDFVPAFSGRGPTADGLAKPDIAVPGAHVVSLRSPGSYVEEHAPGGALAGTPYRRGSGTSMSAGVTSGGIALLLQAHPDWSPDRVKFALAASAHQVGSSDPLAVGAGIPSLPGAAFAPAGLANQNVVGLSDLSGGLEGARGNVHVTRPCAQIQQTLDPSCVYVHGDQTAQDGRGVLAGSSWQAQQYAGSWTGSSWYASQWAGSSWQGSSWYGSSWQGSSWQGASFYGAPESSNYGTALAGSSWYGAWD